MEARPDLLPIAAVGGPKHPSRPTADPLPARARYGQQGVGAEPVGGPSPIPSPSTRNPQIVKVLEAEELGKRADYSRPHTLHCGPEGLYISCLGGYQSDGPGGIALMDHDSFDVLGRWEVDRGPSYYGYDIGWHLAQDTAITSEWGTPSMIENGLVPELLLGKKYGRNLHVWDLRKRRHLQTLELPEEHQITLEMRPAHDPTKAYGFVNNVISVADLSSSVWASVDDRFLYVSCWGTGELRQYDVSDPPAPKLIDSTRVGGIATRSPHPSDPGTPRNGGPQMVEVSRDGRRVYVSNSLYGAWDPQFYPDGINPWIAKLDVGADGGLAIDDRFFPTDFDGRRAHQVRLEGGDASSDTYCYP